MLRASVDEVDASFNERFLKPCRRVFGTRPVDEYLLFVLESGDDFQKAGAACALYFADPNLTDLWERRKKLFLETFVSNTDLDVRRVLIAPLDLDETGYPDSHKPLVRRAIQIASEHSDDYIRHLRDFS
jgi:hypothetical protein